MNIRNAEFMSTWRARFENQWVWLYLGVIGSLLLRVAVLDFESWDYRVFLSVWYDRIVTEGRWASLAGDFVTYPPPYACLLSLCTLLPVPKLYAVKAISILFDYVAAWLVFRLVRCRYPDGPLPAAAAILTLFLPTL